MNAKSLKHVFPTSHLVTNVTLRRILNLNMDNLHSGPSASNMVESSNIECIQQIFKKILSYEWDTFPNETIYLNKSLKKTFHVVLVVF